MRVWSESVNTQVTANATTTQMSSRNWNICDSRYAPFRRTTFSLPMKATSSSDSITETPLHTIMGAAHFCTT